MSGEDVRKNLIERYLQLYMNQKELIDTLSLEAKIEPSFTELVGRAMMGSLGNNLYGGATSSIETVARPSRSDAVCQRAIMSPPIEEVIQSGVVPRFVQFLTREDFPQLQGPHSRDEALSTMSSEGSGVKAEGGPTEHASVPKA
ncbi:hypothetical protein ZWY2020_014709 [Hordeum vulgare]|nr:hypothetical protein ZWY2020_014709 [Hordeum vulgare]